MATNVVPLGKRVIVRPKKEEEVTASGIILSDAGKEKPMEGEVIAVSDEVKGVSVGDKVIFKKYSPTEFKLDDGEEVYVLEMEDLLAKVV